MKAKKQILNYYQPNVFLSLRKVFGILFLCLVQLISAHIGVGSEENIGKDDSIVFDSLTTDHQDQLQSKGNIYVSSGTTVVAADNTDFNIVRVEIASVKPKTKKESSPKKIIAIKKHEKKDESLAKEKKFVNNYRFSGSSPSEISFSTHSKTRLAVINSSNNKIENGDLMLLFFYFKNIILDTESELFSYSDSFLSNYQFTILFVRPPPVVI